MICPVCGAEDCAAGHYVQSVGEREPTKPRVPLQTTRRGRAGYIGDVEVYDPQYPYVHIVTPEPEQADDEAERETKRRRRKTEDK